MLCMHRLAPPALALLLAAVGLASAQEPRRVNLDASVRQLGEHANQQLANAIAQELRASGQLRHYRIDVACQEGLAELSGFVSDATQYAEAARLAQGVPGVGRVINKLRIMDGRSAPRSHPVTRAQFEEDPELAQAPGGKPPEQVGPKPRVVDPESGIPELVPPPRAIQPDQEFQEPIPSFRAPAPPPTGSSLPPPMPPYAWPTFAPYNNYSRVAYPQAYPDGAFPCIGPVYPFPKVPLTWRSVSLQYDDGHWWLMTHGQKKDWWVLRYW